MDVNLLGYFLAQAQSALNFNLVGPALALGLSCIGCCVGSWIAGSASHAAMSRVEEGQGKFIALSIAPSSQVIYGFLLMREMNTYIQAGTLSPISAIAIGLFSGLAFMFSSIFQGRVCATGMQATLKQPAVFGKTFVAIGVIETFALFAYVFARMLYV